MSNVPNVASLWRLVPVNEIDIPTEPPSEAVRLSLRAWWKRVRGKTSDSTWRVTDLPELEVAPEEVLDRLLPGCEQNIGGILAETLDAQFDKEQANRCLVLIAPPYSQIQTAVTAWAEQNDALVLAPPAGEQILDGSADRSASWPESADELLVIAGLERFFLRHHRGLSYVRSIVDRIWRTRQRGVIVCNSWAWAFLQHVCSVDLIHPSPLTLAPFHADSLDQWFAQSVRDAYPHMVSFRRADNGKKALRIAEEDASSYSAEYLTHLAAYSRGNPVVARAIWRQSLQVPTKSAFGTAANAPNKDAENNVKDEARARAAADQGQIVWVKPWSKVPLPSLPAGLADVDDFVLYALLIHSGVARPILEQLLSGVTYDIPRSLRQLQTAGIIDSDHGVWRVTPDAYPAVRERLSQAGFSVDIL